MGREDHTQVQTCGRQPVRVLTLVGSGGWESQRESDKDRGRGGKFSYTNDLSEIDLDHWTA